MLTHIQARIIAFISIYLFSLIILYLIVVKHVVEGVIKFTVYRELITLLLYGSFIYHLC